uniref:Uncharacterized protein n=1 Tax=Setaria viridis TaxID=4556 RepID=A0A4V6D9I4_SETVI|nr:hypothetical protein SEVIR_3G163400v2 [Setaria viridis]
MSTRFSESCPSSNVITGGGTSSAVGSFFTTRLTSTMRFLFGSGASPASKSSSAPRLDVLEEDPALFDGWGFTTNFSAASESELLKEEKPSDSSSSSSIAFCTSAVVCTRRAVLEPSESGGGGAEKYKWISSYKRRQVSKMTSTKLVLEG